jgi:hypothetical protein
MKYQQGDHNALAERAMLAKKEFSTSYYEPAFAKCPVRHGDGLDAGRHDLISFLAAGVDPHWADDGLRLRESISMMIASVNATAGTITHAVDELDRWIASHPVDRARLTEVGFMSRVVQETLRLHPSAPTHTRIALNDIVLSTGRVIKKGQWVIGSATSANRDERLVGPEPQHFNPHREVAPRVPRYATSFGAGPHQCIGLRLVLGNGDAGPAADALRVLYAAGVEPDRQTSAPIEPSLQGFFASYPVIFREPFRAVDLLDGQI